MRMRMGKPRLSEATRPVSTFPGSTGWVERHAARVSPMSPLELDIYFEQMKADADRLVKGWSVVPEAEMLERIARVSDR